MNLAKIATAAVMGLAFAAPSLADNSRQLEDLIAKECQAQAGMVSKAKFMAAVEKRFDAMATKQKDMVSVKDAVRIISGDQKIWVPAH
ncbi:MAG: hypothetical protein AB7O31_19070 [Burkholderiales bacterium]